MIDSEKATLFDRLRKGMEDSIAYSRGEVSLRTAEFPPRRRVPLLRSLRRSSARLFLKKPDDL
jgi:hypothetical protein